jgi:hypothetical protein
MGLPVAGSDTASRARSLTTDLGEKPIQGTVGVSMGSPPLKASVLPPKEELPTSFEVKARIMDFYPITLDEEDCLLRVCGDCKKMSVPLFFCAFVSDLYSKDRKNRRVLPQLLKSGTSSACCVPFLAFIHVGHGKRRRTRGSGRECRCKSCPQKHL